MILAAARAGEGLMRHFRRGSELVVELKGPADFVSVADREADEAIRETLLDRYPRVGFLTEESAPTRGLDASTRFVVDPLDGTANFVHGIPHFAVSIALERRRVVVAGVVFDPCQGEMFVAERGRGAWLLAGGEIVHDGAGPSQASRGGASSHTNRKASWRSTGPAARLEVARDRDLSLALVAAGIPHANRTRRHGPVLRMLRQVMREAAGVRRMAAAALDLAYVAAGRFAAYFELGLSPWDVAAGALLVREAGGAVSEPTSEGDFFTSGDVLATNGHLHPQMRALLRREALPASSRPPRRRTPPTG
jgi:myo-inositol-1(or 4)-monophosphatase